MKDPSRPSQMPYVNDVFALIAFLIIWTSTTREMADADAIYVARCASHLDCFFWSFVCAFSSAIDDEHPVSVSPIHECSFLSQTASHLCPVARSSFSRYDNGAFFLNIFNLFSSCDPLARALIFLFFGVVAESRFASLSSPVRSTKETL